MTNYSNALAHMCTYLLSCAQPEDHTTTAPSAEYATPAKYATPIAPTAIYHTPVAESPSASLQPAVAAAVTASAAAASPAAVQQPPNAVLFKASPAPNKSRVNICTLYFDTCH